VHGSEALAISEQELGLLLELTKAGVPFMIVGVSAAVAQGADTVTKDIDPLVSLHISPGRRRGGK
jgi:hypothetical protein